MYTIKEIKDLIFIEEKPEEVEIKTENKNETKMIKNHKKGIKIIKNNDIQEIVEVKKEKETPIIRKYFKYKDGKVRYHRDFTDNVKKEGFSLKDVKENIKQELTREKKRFDKKSIINMLLLGFVVFSAIFVYFYYFKDVPSHQIDSPPIAQEEITKENNKPIVNNNSSSNDGSKDNNEKSDGTITKGELEVKIVNSLRDYNTSEVKAIEKYIGVKGNKVSTLTAIKKHKESKEKLFTQLIENENLFKKDKDTYDDIEEMLIVSILMSDEFLLTFKNEGRKSEFEDIISKYQN